MSYITGDQFRVNKTGIGLREFCRKFRKDYPIVYKVCEKLEIKKDIDELFKLNEFDQARILEYIAANERNKYVMIDRNKSWVTCSLCQTRNDYEKQAINKNTRWWIICGCGKKTEVTNRMIKLDNL